MKLNDPISAVLRQKGSRRVIAVKPSQSVFEAIELMARESVGAVLVLSENKLVGILSERDYARKVILKGHSSKDTPVHDEVSQRSASATEVFFRTSVVKRR